MENKLIIIGCGGHGKVILDIALNCGYEVAGFLDDDRSKRTVSGYPVLGLVSDVEKYKDQVQFVIGLGSNALRSRLSQEFDAHSSIHWATLIHPSAVLGRGVQIGHGTVVMANAVLNADAHIGRHCIINTGAIVEHDNQIGDYTHISPGAVLSGTVMVGARCHIGARAAIRNNCTICDDCTIGMGAVVVKNIEEEGTYIGVPAKKI